MSPTPKPVSVSPVTAPINPKRKGQKKNSTIPPSPYICPIPNALTTTISFSSYTAPIPETAALECIIAAFEDVETALRDSDPDRRIPQRLIMIDGEHALLSVTSVEGWLEWVTWGQTFKALMRFLYMWEYVGL
ncbi:hypothetical protein IMSHALPRED_006554 [Imshaugia aleurites]|uniref:Uncharacterized protein n=1 Tax=Imshaugia aleurites TaxID=172621 RepID=A0A8H3EM89_9LECA|nr:hypothetical protein IMSHALPRED_006554 [Imshaugia aleurites]